MSSFCWILVGMCSFGQIAEPTERQEPLRVLVGRLASTDQSIREQVAQTICDGVLRWDPIMDPNWPDSKQRTAVRDEVRPMLRSLIELLGHTDPNVRKVAIQLLAHIGYEARDAIPTLSKIARRNESPAEEPYLATVALLYIVPESQPVMGLWYEWRQSLSAVSETESESPDGLLAASIGLSVPVIAGPMMHSGHTKSEVPMLLTVARHERSATSRALAIAVLGELGADARSAISNLRALLKDKHPLVRRCALGAILQIDVDCRTVTRIDPLEMWSAEEYAELQRAAVEYRKQKEKEARETVAFIGEYPEGLEISVATLKYCSGFHRRQTLRLLAEVGSAARIATPEIQKLLRDADPETRQLARDALCSINPPAIASSRCSTKNNGLLWRSAAKPWIRCRR